MPGRGRQWTTKEEEIFMKNYPKMTAKELGALIGRTQQSVWSHARILIAAGRLQPKAQKDTRPARQQRSEMLCWKCSRAYGKCSWSKGFIPVKGWKTVKRRDAGMRDFFVVVNCPKFEAEEKVR